MTVAIIALSVTLLISIAINFRLNSLKNQYRNKVARNNGTGLVLAIDLWKEIQEHKDANFKNQEMIEELISTNQAQARKIQELKNRISF